MFNSAYYSKMAAENICVDRKLDSGVSQLALGHFQIGAFHSVIQNA